MFTAAGFEIRPGDHPIVPIMLYDAKLSQLMAKDLLDEGIYVIGFSFPVVPKGREFITLTFKVRGGHIIEHHRRGLPRLPP